VVPSGEDDESTGLAVLDDGSRATLGPSSTCGAAAAATTGDDTTASSNPGGLSILANATASGPYGTPNLPIASRDAMIRSCSGVAVGRPVVRELGKANCVREAVWVSGREMEWIESVDGEVSEVMLGLAECEDAGGLGRFVRKGKDGRAGPGGALVAEVLEWLRWCWWSVPPLPMGIDSDIRLKKVLNPDC
jgi:hypothetical protein